ncbi:TPA: hypothetical protein QDC22_004338 [Burkholderia stabilis]|nr:hypothetical protein [Burkholderia stabilis]HDR9650468.1 hypothetical protein [Burkholderia stabilis]HDR9680524.1 hypothetical protein [Burkholderia stabilis]
MTVKLFSYKAANDEIELKNVEHQQHKRLNNQAENSREQTRVREKVMRRFNSARRRRQFTSVEGQVENLFMDCRYHRNATQKHEACAQVAATRERASCTRWTAEADSRVSNMPQGVRLPNT